MGTSSGSLLAVSGASAGSGSVLEAPDLVAGLDDLEMVDKLVEECRGHLQVAEGEVCCDDGGGSLAEPAHEVEEKLPKWQHLNLKEIL